MANSTLWATKKGAVIEAVKSFTPLLVFNRVNLKRKNIYLLQLQKLLRTYVGVDFFPLLGEIPVDPVVEQSVSAYQPVVTYAPDTPAAKAIAQITHLLLEVMEARTEVSV